MLPFVVMFHDDLLLSFLLTELSKGADRNSYASAIGRLDDAIEQLMGIRSAFEQKA